jgi:hypothetical protein
MAGILWMKICLDVSIKGRLPNLAAEKEFNILPLILFIIHGSMNANLLF